MFTVVIPICSLLFSLIVETGKFSASKEVRINYTMLTLILLQITTGGYVLLVCTYYYSSFATDIITAMLDDHCKRIVITFILPVIQHGHQSLCHFNLSGMAANHLLNVFDIFQASLPLGILFCFVLLHVLLSRPSLLVSGFQVLC